MKAEYSKLVLPTAGLGLGEFALGDEVGTVFMKSQIDQ